MRWINWPRPLLWSFWGVLFSLFLFTFVKYPGNGLIYILFSICYNVLLYFGFRRKALFFDTFIGGFLWLGFWLKLSLRVAFTHATFSEPTGFFDGSPAAFDHALLVSSCGCLGLLAASWLRGKFIFNYPDELPCDIKGGLFLVYQKHRKALIFAFLCLIFEIGVTNVYLGIYQKGSITRTVLPFGLNGVYKWLLLFGLASISALIIRFEAEISKKNYWLALILGLLESFVSNVSQLSRGMILNGSALIYGTIAAAGIKKFKIEWRQASAVIIVFCILFVSSVLTVNYIRSDLYAVSSGVQLGWTRWSTQNRTEEDAIQETQATTNKLFIDRWLGMEGVMAVSSYPYLGWNLWKTAWRETYNEHATSFYDNNIITSPYKKTNKRIHHFITMPGIVAFFFYPGSYIFLFSGMLALGLIGGGIELMAYKLGNANTVLCSLMAQVVAYRYASFGYVPRQSYLLFGSIVANLLIIYFADKFFWLPGNRSRIVR